LNRSASLRASRLWQAWGFALHLLLGTTRHALKRFLYGRIDLIDVEAFAGSISKGVFVRTVGLTKAVQRSGCRSHQFFSPL
jgi:hypothetical protein